MFVSSEEILRLLQVDRPCLRGWTGSGYLQVVPHRGITLDSVNHLLARTARNFDPPPTWDDITSGRLKLLSVRRVMTSYGLSHGQVDDMRLRYNVPHLRLVEGRDDRIRFCAQSVETHVADMGRREMQARLVEGAFAAHILGCADPARLWWPPYNFTPTLYNGQHWVGKEELRRYLRLHVPAWVTVDNWLEACWFVERPYVVLDEVAAQYEVSPADMMAALQEERGLYMAGYAADGSPTTLIATAWFEARMRYEEPVQPADLARLYGIDTSTVRGWRRNGQIHCIVPEHQHTADEPYLRRSCWLAWLYRLAQEHDVDPERLWYIWASRLAAQSPPALYTTGEVGRMCGVHENTVRGWIAEGRLYAIFTPTGTARCAENWVRSFMANR